MTSVLSYNAKFCLGEFHMTLDRSVRVLLCAGGYLNRGKDIMKGQVDACLGIEQALPDLADTFLMLSGCMCSHSIIYGYIDMLSPCVTLGHQYA